MSAFRRGNSYLSSLPFSGPSRKGQARGCNRDKETEHLLNRPGFKIKAKQSGGLFRLCLQASLARSFLLALPAQQNFQCCQEAGSVAGQAGKGSCWRHCSTGAGSPRLFQPWIYKCNKTSSVDYQLTIRQPCFTGGRAHVLSGLQTLVCPRLVPRGPATQRKGATDEIDVLSVCVWWQARLWLVALPGNTPARDDFMSALSSSKSNEEQIGDLMR